MIRPRSIGTMALTAALCATGVVLAAPAYADQTPYSTPGNYVFTVPDGVTRITASVTGAGGGGGGGSQGGFIIAPPPRSTGGGGGGGGATVRCRLNVQPGDRLLIHVAAGGASGPGGGNGENGDTSHIAILKTIQAQANGGVGGQAGSAGGGGGIGGIAASCGKGVHAKLHSGSPGADGSAGGAGGAPGKKVPSACPTGTGKGGDGANGGTPDSPGNNGCVVLLNPRKAPPRCSLPLDPGPGRANLVRWGYDVKVSKCVTFLYGGAGGNANRFLTEAKCEAHCG